MSNPEYIFVSYRGFPKPVSRTVASLMGLKNGDEITGDQFMEINRLSMEEIRSELDQFRNLH